MTLMYANKIQRSISFFASIRVIRGQNNLHFVIGPNGKTVLPYNSLSTCARPV